MSHKHNHHHHHNFEDTSILKLWISIFLNLIITIAEFVGGILSNSLALLSDAVHNLNDTISLAISLVARKVSKKDVTKEKTYGYKRAEIIGAFINLITLVIVALFLIKEGFERFFDPQPIDGFTMFWVAIVGLLGNFITAALLYKDSKNNLNMKSAYIHILSDGLSSVGVIIGGWLILKYQWYIVDTILTIGIGAYILWHSYHLLRETIDILMQAAPPEMDITELQKSIVNINKVCDVHHVHVWQLDEHQTMLECHVVVQEKDITDMESIKADIKKVLHDDFSIHHSTLEFEYQPCDSVHHETSVHNH